MTVYIHKCPQQILNSAHFHSLDVLYMELVWQVPPSLMQPYEYKYEDVFLQ